MISLKRYLEMEAPDANGDLPDGDKGLLIAFLSAYRSTLRAMGESATQACPPVGTELKLRLDHLQSKLKDDVSARLVVTMESSVRDSLSKWGQRTALHLGAQAGEIKELLLVLARTAEAVGERDQRCARQLHECTTRLQTVAKLEDLTAIRTSVLKTASELKTSVDRMAQEGQAAIAQLRSEVSNYKARLEEAEKVASRDCLTGLRNRQCIEDLIDRRVRSALPFCLVLLDLDDFKKVNDTHGHLAGDELLKQFAFELRSASRSTDIIGRWGGDEFIIVLDCNLPQAIQQTARLRQWLDGNYTLETNAGTIKLHVAASVGLVERHPGESLKDTIARADEAMYSQKAAHKSVPSIAARA